MAPDARQIGWLKLLLAPGFGPALIERLKLDPETLPELPDWRVADLERAGLAPAVVRALKRPDADRMAACEAWLARPGHHLVSLDDALYPPLLRALADAPLALFVNGRPDWLPHPQ
ncbi:MAG: DNA-protecting protein DprA, partial [Wenzhouxiangellaceae bacterium]